MTFNNLDTDDSPIEPMVTSENTLDIQEPSDMEAYGRGRATVGYVMFNMLTIGTLYTQLSRKLFIGLRNSLVHCEANINRFPMNPRIFKSDE